MDKKVVIINGQGRSGKGTVCEIVNEYISCRNISTVDIVKKAYTLLGWDGKKSEIHRKALSDIKDISSRALDHPYHYCKQEICRFLSEECTFGILFIDVREPEEIARIAKDFCCKTLLVTNKNIPKIDSNHADANVENYNYDFHIWNDGTLDDLRIEVQRFLMELADE